MPLRQVPPTERLAPLQHPHILAARLGKAALLPSLVLPLLGKMPVFPRPLPPFPLSLLLSCLHWKTGDLLTPLTPQQVKLIFQQKILGKVAGNPQGKGPPGLPGGSYHLPGRQQLHCPPQSGPPRFF